MPTNYKIGQGTISRIATLPTGNAAPSFTILTGVKTLQLASIETARVDSSSFDSGLMRVYRPGMQDASETTFTGIWDAGQSQDTLIAGYQDNRTEVVFNVSVPNSSSTPYLETHQGFVTKYDRGTDYENLGEFTVTLSVNKITRGA